MTWDLTTHSILWCIILFSICLQTGCTFLSYSTINTFPQYLYHGIHEAISHVYDTSSRSIPPSPLPPLRSHTKRHYAERALLQTIPACRVWLIAPRQVRLLDLFAYKFKIKWLCYSTSALRLDTAHSPFDGRSMGSTGIGCWLCISRGTIFQRALLIYFSPSPWDTPNQFYPLLLLASFRIATISLYNYLSLTDVILVSYINNQIHLWLRYALVCTI